MAVSTVYSVCPHDCPDTCGCLTTVENGRATGFAGDPQHPVTRGWLCAKVNDYLELVYHPERLRYPLRRVTPKHAPARFERITWETALACIAERWQHLIDTHGAETLLPYSFSGTLGLVQMGVASERLWNRLGASRLRRSICGAAAEAAVQATLGGRFAAPYEHVRETRLLLVWGHNPHSTAPHFMPFLRDAQRAGCEVVVIDPRRSRTAASADQHIAPLPGTDAALALALAHVMLRDGLHDRDWLARHALGFEAFARRAQEFSPQRVAAISGIDATVIEDLARRYAHARPALIKMSDGINRNLNGGQAARAVCCLPALAGQYGVRGAGLAYSTSDTLRWDDAAVARREGCPPAGREINMNRLGAALAGEVDGPPVHALYVFGANPAASAPNAARVQAGLQREDLFTVVHELFMTDTAALADIVLPATSQLEQVDLHKGYGHHWLAYNRKAIAPLGEARSNWDTQRALARALGLRHESLEHDADAVIDEVFAASLAANPSLAGIDLEHLRRDGGAALHTPDRVPFADGVFPTPSGKVELHCEAMREHDADPLPDWRPIADPAPAPEGERDEDGLQLVTPASHHFVSSTFGNRADMLRRERQPLLDIHPADAEARGIGEGDRVRVGNRRGSIVLRARLSTDVRRGVVSSPKGWWNCAGHGRNVNWTTSDALADLAGQSVFQSNRVWLHPLSSAATHPHAETAGADNA